MTLSSEDVQVLMTQYRLRISEKLKSAYPDAVWKWDKEPTLRNLMDGDTARIRWKTWLLIPMRMYLLIFMGGSILNP